MIEELIEVVTEDNQLVEIRSRKIVHQTGLWHRGVHIFLFTPEGKLLVQQRSERQDTYPLALDCSVSEHLRPGESYLDGAIRGMKEELGTENVPLQRLLQFRMNYGRGDNMINELYQGSIKPDLVDPDKSEINRILYYSPSELERLMSTGTYAFSPWFKQLLFWYEEKPSEVQILWSSRG
jgi:isopentenyl-diphosphate delta-isomerase type 1